MPTRTKIIAIAFSFVVIGAAIAIPILVMSFLSPGTQLTVINHASSDIANVRVKTQTRQFYWPRILSGDEFTVAEDKDLGMIWEVQWEAAGHVITRELDGICEYGEKYYIRILDNGEVDDGWR